MPEAVFLVGPPFCGKTTFAKLNYPSWRIIPTEIQVGDPGSQALYPHGFYNELSEAVGRGQNIVFDGCNHLISRRANILAELKRQASSLKVDYNLTAIHFNYAKLSMYIKTGRFGSRRDPATSDSDHRRRIAHFVAAYKKVERPSCSEGFNYIRALRFPIDLFEVHLIKAAFFQVDAVIVSKEGEVFPTHPSFVQVLPEANHKLIRLEKAGFKLIAVSNRMNTYQSETAFQDVLIEAVKKIRANVTDLLYCPHTPFQKCLCRMPKPFLASEAVRRHNINLNDSVMVGISVEDRQFAEYSQIGRFINVRADNIS